MADEPNEPQSVADASRAMAGVGFNADTYVEGGTPPAPEPIVEPTSIADRQRAASEPAATQAVPVPATTQPGATPPAPATPAAAQTPEQIAWEAFKNSEESQREAFNIREGLKTEAGVRMIVAQGLTALGKDPTYVQLFMEGKLTQQQVEASPSIVPPAAALAGATAIGPEPWDALTEEDLVDGVQAKEWFTKIRNDAVAAARAEVQAAQVPVQQAVRAEQSVRAGQVTDQTLIELLSENGDPRTVDKQLAGKVIQEANKYIDPNNWDSGHIRAAIIQGHNDVVQIAALAQRAYLNRKDLVAQEVPQTIGGAQAPGADPLPEPKNVKDASKMAKQLFGW